MSESTASLYNRSAERWRRVEPVLLSDFTARPHVLDWCQPIEGARVLDLGCGEGYMARRLLELGAASVHGIDISAEMIERASAEVAPGLESRCRFEVGTATELDDLEAGTFDLVLCVFLFNYLTREEMTSAMTHAVRLLRPGGTFVFSAPHPSLAFLRPQEKPFYFSRGEHGYFSGRDRLFEGEIWRRDGASVPVRCVHKTMDDFFEALEAAGFRSLPRVKELHVTEEHIAFDSEFFGPLRDTPLHVAFRLER